MTIEGRIRTLVWFRDKDLRLTDHVPLQAETKAFARLVNDRDPLIADLLGRHGPSVYVRELARLHETVAA